MSTKDCKIIHHLQNIDFQKLQRLANGFEPGEPLLVLQLVLQLPVSRRSLAQLTPLDQPLHRQSIRGFQASQKFPDYRPTSRRIAFFLVGTFAFRNARSDIAGLSHERIVRDQVGPDWFFYCPCSSNRTARGRSEVAVQQVVDVFGLDEVFFRPTADLNVRNVWTEIILGANIVTVLDWFLFIITINV